MIKNAKILWIDLEMTGLDPASDRILEVAAIATDWGFNEIATYESAVRIDESILKNRMIGDFWETFSETREALRVQNSAAELDTRAIELQLIGFVKANFAEELAADEKILLAGNSIHQDRRFIRNVW